MSRKRDNEEMDRLTATYDALYNALGDVPIEEVRRALAEAGIDRTALRERLHARANETARSIRAAGHGASPAVTRLIEQTGPATALPADPARALDKARQYMANLFGPGAAGATPQIVGAFRGEGDLTARDQDTIDDIDAELRARADAADKDEPPEG
jgi:hypothetical protein